MHVSHNFALVEGEYLADLRLAGMSFSGASGPINLLMAATLGVRKKATTRIRASNISVPGQQACIEIISCLLPCEAGEWMG